MGRLIVSLSAIGASICLVGIGFWPPDGRESSVDVARKPNGEAGMMSPQSAGWSGATMITGSATQCFQVNAFREVREAPCVPSFSAEIRQ